MSETPETIEQTQPNQPPKEDDTQPLKPVRKSSRWRSILTGLLGILVLVGLGGFGGFRAGIDDRLDAQAAVISKQLAEQYQFALVDIEFGRFEFARQRLEFIISKDPDYPGASETLTEVLVLSAIPTSTPSPTLTPTPDFSGAESAYLRAVQLIQAQDWPAALGALDTIRKLDKTYKTAQVDGMYYFALRNYGVDQINKQGNLEGGIYQLTLAERFGPLDRTAQGLREGARLFLTGASFWELDWSQAVDYFSQVNAGWSTMWDGTMNASQRYFTASYKYGDQLFDELQYCDAYQQYQNAAALGQLNEASASRSNQAFLECNPPTPTVEVLLTTAVATTPSGATTEPPPPTDPPTETATPPS
jgi:hypothetical protein